MKAKFICILFLLPVFLLGQPSQQEQDLQKYWRFRERLKNFVVPGEEAGCSLISSSREKYYDHDGVEIHNGFLNYGDQTQFLGHYIGMLAMEYKMQKDNGLASSPTAAKTLQELAYALEAVNRLDHQAEILWGALYTGPSCLFSDPTQNIASILPLNGFFIREDVPADFTNNMVNGNVVENLLNSSYFPVDDGRIVDINKNHCSASGNDLLIGMFFSYYDPLCNFNGRHIGPTEESLDQAIQLMMGLAITVKCIGPGSEGHIDPTHVVHFSDGLTGIAEEAQNIANRITTYMQVFHWSIQNPITCSCVKGIKWANDVSDNAECKCGSGGSIMDVLAYGMAYANCRIQTANLGVSLGSKVNADSYYCNYYDCYLGCASTTLCTPTTSPDLTLRASRATWDVYFRDHTISDDSKICTLAAISHVWNEDTESKLYDRCTIVSDKVGQGSEWHYPLLHNFLYPDVLGDSFFNESLYEGMLSTCECYSSHNADESEYNDWANANGLMYGGLNNSSFSSETNNLSYLFYFNLYNLYKPSYFSGGGTSYRYIDPSQLCEKDIYKNGMMKNINGDDPSSRIQFVESDQKGFHASNSINVSAGDDNTPYVIANDDDLQPWPLAQANIVYEAGKEINLHPGFEVHAGAEFHATINTTLNPLFCTGLRRESSAQQNALTLPQNKMNNATNEQLYQTYNEILQQKKAEQSTRFPSDKKDRIDCSITPNPNNGSFQITLTKNNEPLSTKEIKVYDMLGNVIWENGPALNGVFNVNITSYAAGVYYVKYIDEFDKIEIKKIIKQ